MPTERPRIEVTDVDALKALANPRRQQILEELSLRGPATSAMLARALDLNTGATSYHLRELERFGFVEEAERRGSARQRWWRVTPRDVRFPPRSRQGPQVRPVFDEMNRLAFAADVQLFERLQRESDGLGEWMDAFPHSRGSIQVTLDELRSFFEEYIALLNRYKRDEADMPADAKTVLTRFFAFPAIAAGTEHEGAGEGDEGMKR